MGDDFLNELGKRVLLLDGAMGTMIATAGAMQECNEELCLSRPDVIRSIHKAYLDAGSDIVTTNTFGASSVVLADHGLAGEVARINEAAVAIARRACEEAGGIRFVAGELGPTSKLPTLGHISFAELESSYLEQVKALLAGGVDIVVAQTCQDPLQAKAAASAWRRACAETGISVPFMVSVTMERTGTMLLGTEILSALTTLAPYGPCAFGINCATGPEDMEEYISQLSSKSPLAIVCQPNAGMPENVDGKSVYNLSPEEFSARLADYVDRFGIAVVGGCCGTTPDHIAALATAVKGKKVRAPVSDSTIRQSVSSLYTYYDLDQEPKPFIVAEQTNVNGSKQFREFLLASDYDSMADVGKRAARDAHALDLCVAYAGRDEGLDMSEVVGRLAQKSPIPIMIDSTNPDTIEAALARVPGRAIINSINLEDEAKAKRVLGIAGNYGAAVVALTIDESGMAKDVSRKLQIAGRLVALARNEGLDTSSLLVDTLTFTLASGDAELKGAGRETLAAVGEMKKKFPSVKTILGVSNISFGLPLKARAMVTSAFLTRAVESGLDAAIINPARIVPVSRIPAEALEIINRLIDGDDTGGDPLTALLGYMEAAGDLVRAKAAEKEPSSPEEALAQKIAEGSRDGMGEIIDSIAARMDPGEIINTVLLPAMQSVGEEFGAGRLPLPFVLQSAETMRYAIDLVSERMKGGGIEEKGTIVLATVRGDVHDIGKNLVDAILANNGFRVVNLGIKQGAATIIEAARKEGADAIGLSGLLVSSTEVMREDLALFRESGLTIPVLCGGAALTPSFVEDALTRAYGNRVVYCRDAFSGLKAMENISRESIIVDRES